LYCFFGSVDVAECTHKHRDGAAVLVAEDPLDSFRRDIRHGPSMPHLA
jgi:hypothetical protein